MRAARIARGAHAQLARRIGAQKITLHAPGLDDLAGAGFHALVVKRRAAFALEHKRVFVNVDVLRENRLAQAVEQKRALAVERAAADGLHKAAQQPRRQRRLEQHRAFSRRNLAAFQTRQRAFGGVAAHGFGRGQFGRVAHRAVPRIALHVFALARNRRDRNAVARTGVAAPETRGVRGEKMALLRRHARAFAVGDQAACAQRGGFALQRQPGRVFGRDGPGVKQIERRVLAGNVLLVGQAGSLVFGGEAGDVVSGLHRLRNRRFGKIAGGRVAALFANIHRDAQRLVAVTLDRFEFALAHAHRQAAAFGGFGGGVGRAQLFGVAQRGIDQVFKKVAVVAETGFRLAGFGAGSGAGRTGRRFLGHSGYDTDLPFMAMESARKPQRSALPDGPHLPRREHRRKSLRIIPTRQAPFNRSATLAPEPAPFTPPSEPAGLARKYTP